VQIGVVVGSLYVWSAVLCAAGDGGGEGLRRLGRALGRGARLLPGLGFATFLAATASCIGMSLFVLPGLALATIWLLIGPAMVVGGAGWWESFGRSFTLVRRHLWGAFVLVLLLLVPQTALYVLIAWLSFTTPWVVAWAATGIVWGALVGPFSAVVVTDAYRGLAGARPPAPAASACDRRPAAVVAGG
jgi:hypothetical protein